MLSINVFRYLAYILCIDQIIPHAGFCKLYIDSFSTSTLYVMHVNFLCNYYLSIYLKPLDYWMLRYFSLCLTLRISPTWIIK